MATRDGKKVPLMRYLTKKLGVRRGYKCMAFIVAWITARVDHEASGSTEEFDVDTYARWWKVGRATAFREQALFREAFPQYATPDDLMAEAQRQRVKSVQELRLAL